MVLEVKIMVMFREKGASSNLQMQKWRSNVVIIYTLSI